MSDPKKDLPELAWCPVGKLTVDARYQRSLSERRSMKLIGRIGAQFSWSHFQALLVTPAKDGWLVIDGQHRAEAARRIGITHVPCVVVKEMDLAEQARAFVGANRDRVAVNPFALYHALVVAGDEAALLTARVARDAGVDIPRYPLPANRMKPGQTMALGAIGRAIAKHGAETATQALRTIITAYDGTTGNIRSETIRAVAGVLARGARTPAQIEAWLRERPYRRLLSQCEAFQEAQGCTLETAIAYHMTVGPVVTYAPAAAVPARRTAPIEKPSPAAKEDAPKKRNCLSCGKSFVSDHMGNRMCDRCKGIRPGIAA